MATARRLEAVYVVRTPEYVEFEFVLAGVMSRLLAWLIDVTLSTAVAAALTVALWLVLGVVPGVAAALTFILWFAVNWGYFVFTELRFGGVTLGKKLLGLRVMQESGVRVGFYNVALRNLVRALDHMPALYVVGGLSALLSSETRRLGDFAGGTVVVRERRRKLPAAIARPEGVSALGTDRQLEDKVRRATVDEREVLFAAALRREELSTEARLALFDDLGRYCEDRFGLARPEHYSPEKLVLEVTAALMRVEQGGRAAVKAAR